MDNCPGDAIFCHSDNAARGKLDGTKVIPMDVSILYHIESFFKVGENLALYRASPGSTVSVPDQLTQAVQGW